MKVILEMPESLVDVLTITAIKGSGFETNVVVMAVNLKKGDHIVFSNDGEVIHQFFESEIYT